LFQYFTDLLFLSIAVASDNRLRWIFQVSPVTSRQLAKEKA